MARPTAPCCEIRFLVLHTYPMASRLLAMSRSPSRSPWPGGVSAGTCADPFPAAAWIHPWGCTRMSWQEFERLVDDAESDRELRWVLRHSHPRALDLVVERIEMLHR